MKNLKCLLIIVTNVIDHFKNGPNFKICFFYCFNFREVKLQRKVRKLVSIMKNISFFEFIQEPII